MNSTEHFQFHVIRSSVHPFSKLPVTTAGWLGYLEADDWDDWRKYCTLFHLYLVDPEGGKHEIGDLKIAKRSLAPHPPSAEIPSGYRTPDIQTSFNGLGEEFFSVGQDEKYYENLNALDGPIREKVLVSLRDIAWDIKLWESVQNEFVLHESLLRFVTRSTVE